MHAKLGDEIFLPLSLSLHTHTLYLSLSLVLSIIHALGLSFFLLKIDRFYRPILIGSSAIAISSVGALLPFFFFEYHINMAKARKLMLNTIHAK